MQQERTPAWIYREVTSNGEEGEERRGSTHMYLRVEREEGELQRPAVLDATGDHAGQEQPEEPRELLPVTAINPAAAALHLLVLLQ